MEEPTSKEILLWDVLGSRKLSIETLTEVIAGSFENL